MPGQLVACRLGNPVRESAAVRGQVGGAADVPGRTAQQRRREQDLCRGAGLLRRGAGGDLPEAGQRLRVGGDDVPEVTGRLVRRPHLHRLGQGRDGDPHQGQRQRNGPWRLHQVGAGPFAGDLEQHPPCHVLDDLVAEIGAGGCLGDPHEGCYGTDLPGDQLTGTLPVKVHAGRSELLQEHVDLAVEPRTSRHVASLPSSRHGARLLRTAGGGNPVVLSPLSPLAVLLLLKPRLRPVQVAAKPDPGTGRTRR